MSKIEPTAEQRQAAHDHHHGRGCPCAGTQSDVGALAVVFARRDAHVASLEAEVMRLRGLLKDVAETLTWRAVGQPSPEGLDARIRKAREIAMSASAPTTAPLPSKSVQRRLAAQGAPTSGQGAAASVSTDVPVATLGVHVDGKLRGTVELSLDASEDDARAVALAVPNVAKYLEGRDVEEFTYRPGRIIGVASAPVPAAQPATETAPVRCKACSIERGTIDDTGHCVSCRALQSMLRDDPRCRGCGAPLLPRNINVADCCPCNSPRGVNHGLVPVSVCTCIECDPAQTGSTRRTGTTPRKEGP